MTPSLEAAFFPVSFNETRKSILFLCYFQAAASVFAEPGCMLGTEW